MYTLTQVILIAVATVVLVLIAIVKLMPDTDEESMSRFDSERIRAACVLLREAKTLIDGYRQECATLRERVQLLETLLKMRNDHGL